MAAADHSETGEGRHDADISAAAPREVDRSHNRDVLTPEAITDMLRDLQDAMLSLDERLAALESSRDGTSRDTRSLAQGVADLGDALSRRVRALERGMQDPAPILAQVMAPPLLTTARAPRRTSFAWMIGLACIVIMVALAAFWLLRAESFDRSSVAAAPAVSRPPPSVPSVAEAPIPPPPPMRQRVAPHVAVSTHRTPRPPAPGTPPADTLPDSGATPPSPHPPS
jgi:hypothetical protein